VHLIPQKEVMLTEMIYLYSKGSGENEHERCTLILRPLIPGIFGSALRKNCIIVTKKWVII